MTDKRMEMRRALMAWYDENKRTLPWREDPSPYHVWISEIMLQQTRVEAVRDYYVRFLLAFPDIPALAAAPVERVLKLWEGLGYYSRARNLHRAAALVMDRYGGSLPDRAGDLEKLPGIGAYTAAAIASIAFGEKVPALDGNLLRIYARLVRCGEEIESPAVKKAAHAWLLDRMDEERPGDFNQALMDLGSLVCLPGAGARCGICPLWKTCECGQDLSYSAYPVRTPKKPRKVCRRTVFVILRGDRVLLGKRPPGGVLAGLYEFPGAEGHLDEAGAVRFLKDLGLSPLRISPLPPARHIFTHLEWDMTGYAVRTDDLSPLPAGRLTEADERQLREEFALPSAFGVYRAWLEDRLHRDPVLP